jgi:hypothetical protein
LRKDFYAKNPTLEKETAHKTLKESGLQKGPPIEGLCPGGGLIIPQRFNFQRWGSDV